MKKIGWIVAAFVALSGLFFWFASSNQQEESPKILTQLEDQGGVDGKRAFVFRLTNVGKQDALLTFPTWLEYNVSIERLGDDFHHEGVIVEDLDLNSEEEGGRGVQLPPNQSIAYRLHLSELHKGRYEIRIDSTSGYGHMQKMEFTVD